MKTIHFTIILLVSLTGCEQIEVTNKTTCLQAYQAIENAKYQQDILEKQLTLATAMGDDAKIVMASARKKELKSATILFETIVEDPKLNCPQYSK